MKNIVFWDVALRRSCANRRFGGTSVNTRPAQRHIPEEDILQEKTFSVNETHLRKQVRSHTETRRVETM
jgi:hypothetical protein